MFTCGMRAIWKGAIAFGLVNVPVKVYSATEDHDVSLHQVHNADGGRIRYQRRCEVCGKVVEYEDIDKAYEDGGRTVVLTEDDLKSIPAESSQEIEVVEFVPAEQLDPIMFDKSYYLEPDSKIAQGLCAAAADPGGDGPDRHRAVRAAAEDPARRAAGARTTCWCCSRCCGTTRCGRRLSRRSTTAVRISAQELKMSAALVDIDGRRLRAATSSRDEYQEQLRTADRGEAGARATRWTRRRRSARRARAGEGEVIDLMEALKRSIEKKRGGGAAETPAKASGSGGQGRPEGRRQDDGGQVPDRQFHSH